MSTTQHTAHYNLPTFGDNENDRPSWRGDFTEAMTTIDNQMYANATNIVTATAAANAATEQARTAKEAADNAAALAATNESDIADLDSYFNALGITSVPTAQNFNNLVNSKASTSDLDELDDKVTTLSNTIGGKANSSDVYTKSQADARYTQQGGYSGTAQTLDNAITSANNAIETVEAVTTELTELVWIGDSYSTGYLPSGSVTEAKRLPQRVARHLGLNLHLYANNASGYVKKGDGDKTFQTLANEALSGLSDDIKKKTKYVVVCGGRNDDSGSVQSVATTVFDTLMGNTGYPGDGPFPHAQGHAIFLWDNSALTDAAGSVMQQIEYAAEANGMAWHPFMWTLGMGHPDWFYNSTDIHYNEGGTNNIAKACAWAISGRAEPCGYASGSVDMTGGCSGTVKWRFSGGVVTLTAKFTASSPSGNSASLPRFIGLGDNFIPVLGNAGNQQAFAHLDGGVLTMTGVTGGGNLTGNCWITPVSFVPIMKN